MDIILSNTSGKPIYEQITDQVKEQIMAGTLSAGDALPSMRLLAKELRISGITTNRAYEELEKDGLCCNIIPRKEEDGRAISASAVRQLIHDGKLEEVRPLVPESTYRFFLTPQGEKVAAAIRAAGEVIHY